MKRLAVAIVVLAAAAAYAKPPSNVIRFKATADDPGERPVATEIAVAPQGSDWAFRVVFNKAPWGEACKTRCANTTVFVDTDDNKTTGLQLGAKAPENGADLAVTLQGSREWGESSSRSVFRAKVKYLPDGAKSLDDGESLSELDNSRDAERLVIEDNTVMVLVDGTSARLPSSKKARVIYHPPGNKALTAPTRGMMASGSSSRGGNVEVFRKGVKGGK